jgi:hypothetical protein
VIEALALLAAFFAGAAFADWSWRRMLKRGSDRNRVQR